MSLTFWVRYVPITLSTTDPPHGTSNCLFPSTPLWRGKAGRRDRVLQGTVSGEGWRHDNSATKDLTVHTLGGGGEAVRICQAVNAKKARPKGPLAKGGGAGGSDQKPTHTDNGANIRVGVERVDSWDTHVGGPC